MKNYMLNDLGEDWIWEANSIEEVTEIFIKDVMGDKGTIRSYKEMCEDNNVDFEINWTEV